MASPPTSLVASLSCTQSASLAGSQVPNVPAPGWFYGNHSLNLRVVEHKRGSISCRDLSSSGGYTGSSAPCRPAAATRSVGLGRVDSPGWNTWKDVPSWPRSMPVESSARRPRAPTSTIRSTLTNASSSNAGIGTFWYAWVPGEDFLATSPISVSPPAGWTDNITNMGAGDGFAIQFLANSPANDVQPGSSLNFSFTTADSPASVNGNSVFFPGTPVSTSFVYPQGPFSDAGHQFVVTPAPTPTPTPTPTRRPHRRPPTLAAGHSGQRPGREGQEALGDRDRRRPQRSG